MTDKEKNQSDQHGTDNMSRREKFHGGKVSRSQSTTVSSKTMYKRVHPENSDKNKVPTGLSEDKKRKKRRNRLIRRVLVVVALLFILCGVTWLAKIYAETNNLLSNAYTPRSATTTVNGKKVKASDVNPQKDPISILVMGIDDNAQRKLGSARTDTMLLITLNPKTSNISMVSIPRDTYVDIYDGKSTQSQGKDKINAAYTTGGDSGAVATVEKFTGITVNYYLTIDFNAFEEIIDALGGITVDVPMDIHSEYASESPNDGPVIIKKGTQTLTGEQALVFARMRKIDNDIKRGERQQLVVRKVAEKAAQVGSITKYSKVVKALNGHFWTDMNSSQMLAIAQSGLTNDYAFHSYTFDWTSFDTPASGSVVGIYDDSLKYVMHKLKVNLGTEQKDSRDASGYTFKSNGLLSLKNYSDYSGMSYNYDTSDDSSSVESSSSASSVAN